MEKEEFSEISLVYKDEEKYQVEKVYAIKVEEYYQLKAIPAFALNVAYDDIISVEYEGGHLFFDSLIKPSGHSVVRVVVLKPEISTNIFAKLISFGVNINYLHNNLYLVIDVPVNVSYSKLKEYLDSEFRLGNIDIEEACISEHHQSG